MRILVIHCHPDPGSLVAEAHRRLLAGLARTRHEIRDRDLYAQNFDPLFTAEERHRHLEPGAAPELADHVADLQWCDTLVLVYPTWWSGQPAMLKGWFDRVWVRGVAWELPEGANRLKPLLRNVRRIIVVTTHGSSKLMNALEGEAGKRTASRSLRLMCHPRCRMSWWPLYGVDRSTEADRRGFLDRIERRAAAL